MLPSWSFRFSIIWSMSSEVIEGHIRSLKVNIYSKIHLYLDIFFVWNLKLSKFCINSNIIKAHIFHNKAWPQRLLKFTLITLWKGFVSFYKFS